MDALDFPRHADAETDTNSPQVYVMPDGSRGIIVDAEIDRPVTKNKWLIMREEKPARDFQVLVNDLDNGREDWWWRSQLKPSNDVAVWGPHGWEIA